MNNTTTLRPTWEIASVAPHPVHAPTSTRYAARCTCGWESYPSLFRAMVTQEAERHAADAHGAAAQGALSTQHDSLAACALEVWAA